MFTMHLTAVNPDPLAKSTRTARCFATWWRAREPQLPRTERWATRVFGARCVLCSLDVAVPAVALCGDCAATLPFRIRPEHEIVAAGADRYCVPFDYAQPVSNWIRALKFADQRTYARLLGSLLAASVAARGLPLPTAIVPIPLHPSRQRERGFNQAERIARAAARWLDLPVRADALLRRRATRAQSSLAAAERRANVRAAFICTGVGVGDSRRRGLVLPRHVAIVDDVVTTGATAAAAAQVLRAAGVQNVELWAMARVVGETDTASEAPPGFA